MKGQKEESDMLPVDGIEISKPAIRNELLIFAENILFC
jgi:hypothetical protein